MSSLPSVLKLVHVDTESTWRGGQQQVVNLVSGLIKHGHENVVVVKNRSALHEKCISLGIPVFPVSPLGEWDFFAAHRLNRFLRSFQPHVIHAHSAHAVGLSAFARLGLQVPSVATRRVDFPLRKNFLSKWKYWQMDRIVAISNGVKQILIQSGIDPKKIDLVPSGVDLHRFNGITPRSRSQLNIPDNSLVIGQVAALAPHKDQSTFLRAIAILRESEPGIRVLLVGDGPLRTQLESLSRSLGLTDVVTFMGFQPDPLSVLAAFDVFCLSSKEEGLGTSIIDAMMLKIPVVATNVGGIPDVLENGNEGVLVAPLDPKALSEGLKKMIHHPNKNKFISAAFEKAKQFDAQVTVSRMETIYRQLSGITAI